MHIFLHAAVQPVRLNVVLDETDAAAVGERAEEAGITRPEWVRRAVSAALCSELYRLGTLDVPAPCEDVQNIDGLHAQITQLQAEIDRLTGETLTLNRLLDEKKDEVSWLRGQVALLNDKLTPASLPERAGPSRPWWKFWEK